VSVVKRIINRILGITEQDLIDQANGVVLEEPNAERPYHHSGKPKPKFPGSEYSPPPYASSGYSHSEYSHYPPDSDLASRASSAYNSKPYAIKTPVVATSSIARIPLSQKPITAAGLAYSSQNIQCTETRVSEDTIMKRCIPTPETTNYN